MKINAKYKKLVIPSRNTRQIIGYVKPNTGPSIAAMAERRNRRTRHGRYANAVSLGLTIAPRRKFLKLTYETNFVGNKVGGNAIGYGLIRANSIFDPEYTNLGKNKGVQGLTKLQSMYNNYKVYSMDAYIEVVNAASKACILGFTVQNDTSATTTSDKITNIATRKGGKSLLLGYLTENRRIKYHVDIKKTEGIVSHQFDDASYGALLTTNPTKQVYLVYAIGQIGEGTDENIAVYFKVRLVYNVLVYNPLEVTDEP